LALHRDALLSAVVASWPANPAKRTAGEWAALWQAAPEGMTKVEVRNRTRQITGFVADHDRLPTSITEVEAPPLVSGQVLLAAADRQQVTSARNRDDPARLTLRVLLPAVTRPGSYRDWQWVQISGA
jgi:hypothetical protein